MVLRNEKANFDFSLSLRLINFLNTLRIQNNVPSVRYANTGFAHFRSAYMLKTRVFSHYDVTGIAPPLFFTTLGNYYYMEESIGYAWSNTPLSYSTTVQISEKLLYDMVYNDADEGWFHRDTLLDPCFNYADISVSFNFNEIYLDVVMINARIDWISTPKISNGNFSLKGRLTDDNFIPKQLIIYRDEPKPDRINDHSYSLGEPVAGVIPKPHYYKSIETIRPYKWRMDSSIIEIEFPLKLFTRGVYTILLHAEDKRKIHWSPYTERKIGECGIMMYSFLVK